MFTDLHRELMLMGAAKSSFSATPALTRSHTIEVNMKQHETDAPLRAFRFTGRGMKMGMILE